MVNKKIILLMINLFTFSIYAESISKLDDDLYQLKMPGNYYLVSERITNSNVNRWADFAEKVSDAVNAMKHSSAKIASQGSIMAFQILVNIDAAPEAWVIYQTDIERKANQKLPDDWESHVEMSFMMSTANNLRFTNHMGILRNPLYKFAIHKNTSVNLHAFAASVALIFDKKKEYMVNDPLPEMRKILENVLPANSYQYGFDGPFIEFEGSLSNLKMIFLNDGYAMPKPKWLQMVSMPFVANLKELAGLLKTQ